MDKLSEIRQGLGLDHEDAAVARRRRLENLRADMGHVWFDLHEATKDLVEAGIGYVQEAQALDTDGGTYTERRGFRAIRGGAHIFAPLVRFRLEGEKSVVVEEFDPESEEWGEIVRTPDTDGKPVSLRSELQEYYVEALHAALLAKGLDAHHAEYEASLKKK